MSPMDFAGEEVSPALSRFIAGLIGPVLATVSISLLLNRGLAPEIAAEVAHGKGLIVLSGAALLVAGLAIVQCHATWRGWAAIITGLGWLSILSGLARILIPDQLAGMATQMTQPPFITIAAVAMLALGAFLSAKAYI